MVGLPTFYKIGTCYYLAIHLMSPPNQPESYGGASYLLPLAKYKVDDHRHLASAGTGKKRNKINTP